MNTEQPGPPTEAERERVSMEWLRISQLRFLEGYKARMLSLHPMCRNARGEQLNTREARWSYADNAYKACPALPAHERERWIAGFLHADGIAAKRGVTAMERADPSRPPSRPKKAVVAKQEDGLAELAPPLSREDARAFWNRHRGVAKTYSDAGEQT